jgi:hypothetical protein
MKDIFVILISLITFSVFLFLHVIMLRKTVHKSVMKWLFYCLIFSNVMILPVISMVIYLSNPGLGKSIFTIMFLSLLDSLALSAVYVFLVYGVSTTSVRITILRLIYSGKNHVISRSAFYVVYNEKIMVKKSLKKLIESGEIGIKNDKYYNLKRKTYFYYHNKILDFYKRCLG